MKKYEIESKITNLRLYLEGLVNDESNYDTWENKKIINCIYMLSESLYEVENSIKYYYKEPKKGRLYLRGDGRYAIDEANYFTCGYGIEMLTYDSYEEKEVWCEGRVECNYTEDGPIYYFLNYDGQDKNLEEGDLVRVRQ